MNDTERFFLKLLNRLNESVGKDSPEEHDLSVPDRFDPEQFLKLAELHELLPFCIESIPIKALIQGGKGKLSREYRDRSVRYAIRQITKKNEFLTLLLHLQAQGLDPVVMKGEVIRCLYPKAYYRPSIDDDLLILPRDLDAFHKALLSEGLEPDEPEVLITDKEGKITATASEVSYHKPGSPLYIELHTALFPPESDIYGDCNRFFNKVMDRTVYIEVEDVRIRTMHPTDHLLYLLLHSYKHFLHSGFGIRHICDLVFFTRAYGNDEKSRVDWEYLYRACESQHIQRFAAALFGIGEQYLSFDPEETGMTEEWKELINIVNADHLLNDILKAGNSSLNRAHSSTITLNAVKDSKEAKKKPETAKASKDSRTYDIKMLRSGIRDIMKTVFPPAKNLEERYTYLKRYRFLLPAAWVSRILHYTAEHLKHQDVSARETIAIGLERVELLKEYKIID